MNSETRNFKIDTNTINEYVEAINFITEPMSKFKKEINKFYKKINLNHPNFDSMNTKPIHSNIDEKYNKRFQQIKSIFIINNYLNYFSKEFPNEKTEYVNELIIQMMNANNGMISTRMIEPLNISRWYLYHLIKDKKIERVSRGIYVASNFYEDSFYAFQHRYKKIIYSHMNALYFYNMTEEIPYNYTVTVPKKYNVKSVSDKCNVFYVEDDIYELGVCDAITPNGNKVKTYDLERSVCDIIRSKNRMDPEQVKKSVKQYVQRKDKDIIRLLDYSRKMGITEQVMEYVGMFYE